MTDKELLELAAKASGFDCTEGQNPLDSDALALRLAVKLGITFDIHYNKGEAPDESCAWASSCFIEKHKQDPYAATRKAIVRAAAEIGKSMEKTNE